MALSMKRLLGSGMAAGGVFLFVRMTPLHMLSIPVFLVAFVVAVYLSGERHGITRITYLLMGVAGSLSLTAHLNPDGITARLLRTAQVDPDAVALDGRALFAAAVIDEDDDYLDLIMVGSPYRKGHDPNWTSEGFRLVRSPTVVLVDLERDA